MYIRENKTIIYTKFWYVKFAKELYYIIKVSLKLTESVPSVLSVFWQTQNSLEHVLQTNKGTSSAHTSTTVDHHEVCVDIRVASILWDHCVLILVIVMGVQSNFKV